MKIKGLKKVCGRTRNLEPNEKLQLLYDTEKNEVFVLPENSKWMGSNTIIVTIIDKYISMEGIKNLILNRTKLSEKVIREYLD